MWTLNFTRGTDVDREVERKIEEFAFAVTLMYGVGGWGTNEERPFRADFALYVASSGSFSVWQHTYHSRSF
jgi:hypothetical protein